MATKAKVLDLLQSTHTSVWNTWDEWSPDLRDKVSRHVYAAYAAIVRDVIHELDATPSAATAAEERG